MWVLVDVLSVWLSRMFPRTVDMQYRCRVCFPPQASVRPSPRAMGPSPSVASQPRDVRRSSLVRSICFSVTVLLGEADALCSLSTIASHRPSGRPVPRKAIHALGSVCPKRMVHAHFRGLSLFMTQEIWKQERNFVVKIRNDRSTSVLVSLLIKFSMHKNVPFENSVHEGWVQRNHSPS